MTRYQGVTLKRIEHGEIARDIICEPEAVFVRQRAKPMLTSWHVRKRMIDELSERPEGYRRRSLAKRLTKLDKALSDLEAYSLDRAFSAWLITAGKSHSVDASGSGVRGSEQPEPLSQQELEEAGKLQEGLNKLPKQYRLQIVAMFNLMAPWHELSGRNWSEEAIRQAKTAAMLLVHIYVGDYKKGA